MAYTLAGQSLDVIITERATKDAGIIVLDVVQSDSSEAEAIQLSGAVENITISGTNIASTLAELNNFINTISNLANGDVTATASYVSDLIGTRNVVVIDFQWDWAAGRTTELNYTIKMTTSRIT